VSVGEPLVEIADPLLQAQLRVAEARVEESQATVTSELLTDRTRVALARDKLDHEQQTLAIIREKAADLIVHANADGMFLVDQKDDMLGRYYRKGEMLGHVIGQVEPLVRVVVPQDAIDRVRVATDRIRLRVVDHPDKVLRGYIVRAVPEGEEVLPSRALAVDGGGDIATDPRDTKDPKALQRMFQFDVGMEDTQPLHHFGQRVFVRFEHQEEPLSVQWYRSVRLLFLSRFSV
jgi:putative peptide zinc metalloprotease protein